MLSFLLLAILSGREAWVELDRAQALRIAPSLMAMTDRCGLDIIISPKGEVAIVHVLTRDQGRAAMMSLARDINAGRV
jgi:hypothetical protein